MLVIIKLLLLISLTFSHPIEEDRNGTEKTLSQDFELVEDSEDMLTAKYRERKLRDNLPNHFVISSQRSTGR